MPVMKEEKKTEELCVSNAPATITENVLEEQLVNLLISKGWHISCAESCTGGLLAASLVNVSNASGILSASFVTYSEEAKQRYAHVKHTTLLRYGVVSEEVASEMARGAAHEASAEVGVGITGLAGPSGGAKDIPVGTVCFGFYVNGIIKTETIRFEESGRNEIRKKAVRFALQNLLDICTAL